MRTLIAAFTVVVLAALSPSSIVAQHGAGQGGAPQAERVALPNYDLAAQWTSEKVRKLVFDTSVTPRWLETSDRFWYSYQTREGRKFSLVDPIKRRIRALLRMLGPKRAGRMLRLFWRIRQRMRASRDSAAIPSEQMHRVRRPQSNRHEGNAEHAKTAGQEG